MAYKYTPPGLYTNPQTPAIVINATKQMLFSWLVAIHRGSKGNTNRLLIGKVGKVGQRMAEAAKGINPQIPPEEVTQEVKEATAEVVEKAPFLASWEKIRPIVLFYALYVMAAALLLAVHLMVL